MRLFIIVLAFIFSSMAHAGGAFNYHGVKSGMSKSEVDGLTGCTEYCSSIDYKETRAFLGGEGNHPPDIWGMGFKYTSDDKLWRIQLQFIERGGPQGVAQLRAITELYPDAEPQSGSSSIGSTQIDTLDALMIDTKLFDADAEKIYQESITKY
jgi:hypothetical protein